MAHHFLVLGFETTYDQKNPLLRGMPSKQPHQATDIKFRSIVLMSILKLCTVQKHTWVPLYKLLKGLVGASVVAVKPSTLQPNNVRPFKGGHWTFHQAQKK